jgi:hypothetical protein
MASEEQFLELGEDINRVAVKYKLMGMRDLDVLSGVAGWLCGTAMKELGWSPEDLGRNVNALAEEIIRRANEISDSNEPIQ